MEIVISPNATKEQIRLIHLAIDGSDDCVISQANDFRTALASSTNEYMCYIGDGYFNTGLFKQGLEIYKENPLYRKLSMISPATESLNSQVGNRIFGYHLDDKGVTPITKRASSEPYLVRIGYLGGSIIRTQSAKKCLPLLTGDMLVDSYLLSTELWITGHRCLINPKSTYVDTSLALEKGISFVEDPWQNNWQMTEIITLWKREVI